MSERLWSQSSGPGGDCNPAVFLNEEHPEPLSYLLAKENNQQDRERAPHCGENSTHKSMCFHLMRKMYTDMIDLCCMVL